MKSKEKDITLYTSIYQYINKAHSKAIRGGSMGDGKLIPLKWSWFQKKNLIFQNIYFVLHKIIISLPKYYLGLFYRYQECFHGLVKKVEIIFFIFFYYPFYDRKGQKTTFYDQKVI